MFLSWFTWRETLFKNLLSKERKGVLAALDFFLHQVSQRHSLLQTVLVHHGNSCLLNFLVSALLYVSFILKREILSYALKRDIVISTEKRYCRIHWKEIGIVIFTEKRRCYHIHGRVLGLVAELSYITVNNSFIVFKESSRTINNSSSLSLKKSRQFYYCPFIEHFCFNVLWFSRCLSLP